MIDLSKHKLKLTYPCKWCYKIVLDATVDPKSVTKDILKDKKHTLTHSKTSKNNKFKTYDIDLSVKDEQERLSFYDKLKNHKDIKMII